MLNSTFKQLKQRILEKALTTSEPADETNKKLIRSKQGYKQEWIFDFRALALCNDDLELLAQVFWDKMEKHFPFQIGCLEMAGIPLLTAILMKGNTLNYSLNGFIVRKSRKKHGRCQQIEGDISQLPIIIIDDIVNSGYSIQRVTAALAQENKTIERVFCYVNFNNPNADDFFTENKIPLDSAFTLEDFNLTLGTPTAYYPQQQTLDLDWDFTPESQPNYTLSVPRSTPVIDSERVYYGADDGFFYAVNKSTGELSWRFQTGRSLKGILSSPIHIDSSVIFGAYDGNLYRLNCSNGHVLWKTGLAEYIGSSPCLSIKDNKIFIGLEHSVYQQKGELAAVDLASGDKVWGVVTSDYIHSSPVYDANTNSIFVGCNNGDVYACDATTGNINWIFTTKAAVKTTLTLDTERQQIIAPSFDGNCYGIDTNTGKENFCLSSGAAFYSQALIVNNLLYIGSCDKKFYIYDLKSQTLIKKLPTMGRIFSSPSHYNNSIWFGSNDGFIRQVNYQGEYMGGILLSERPLTPIIYDEDTNAYFVVTMGNHLVRLSES